MISKGRQKRLLVAAAEARDNSNYWREPMIKFGAALLAWDGTIYTGCNVDVFPSNIGICSERNAFFSAVSQGTRRFKAIAIATNLDEPRTPCGTCRQVMYHFCGDSAKSFHIIIGDKEGNIHSTYTLEELLPHRFHIEGI